MYPMLAFNIPTARSRVRGRSKPSRTDVAAANSAGELVNAPFRILSDDDGHPAGHRVSPTIRAVSVAPANMLNCAEGSHADEREQKFDRERSALRGRVGTMPAKSAREAR
jgi:hypothetical protein